MLQNLKDILAGLRLVAGSEFGFEKVDLQTVTEAVIGRKISMAVFDILFHLLDLNGSFLATSIHKSTIKEEKHLI